MKLTRMRNNWRLYEAIASQPGRAKMKEDRDIEKTLELSAFIAELRRLADSL